MSSTVKRRALGGSIEFENVLQLFVILKEKGYDLTGRLQSHDAFAEYLTMYMADLPNAVNGSARNTSMIFDGIN